MMWRYGQICRKLEYVKRKPKQRRRIEWKAEQNSSLSISLSLSLTPSLSLLRSHTLFLHLLLKEICCKSLIEKVCLPKIDASVEPDWTWDAAEAAAPAVAAVAAAAATNGHKSVSLSFIVHQILLDRRFNFVILHHLEHTHTLTLSPTHTLTHSHIQAHTHTLSLSPCLRSHLIPLS